MSASPNSFREGTVAKKFFMRVTETLRVKGGALLITYEDVRTTKISQRKWYVKYS